MTHTKKHPSGFSLVEVIFAMLLLTVAVMGIAKLHSSQLALASTHNKRVKAYFLAQESLEILEAIGKDGIAAQCGSSPCECALNFGGSYSLDCSGGSEVIDEYKRFIEVDSEGLLNGTWKAESSVVWDDQNGSHTVRSKRIIFE